MDADDLLELFARAAVAARDAVEALSAAARRRAGERPGQYHLDLAADAAVLEVLRSADAAIVSEESGRSGPEDAPVTIVVDPVDGSTNCSRHLPYWAISLCTLDSDGPWCGLVRNQVTGTTTTAIRGRGAWREGEPLIPSPTRRVGDAMVGLAGIPEHVLPWAQYRTLGSAALTLCDVAAGDVDGYVTAARDHAPWDYLGGLLACTEAGATVVDADGRPLAVPDPDARRQLLAAGTRELLDELRAAVAP
ncbi:MAG: inositol monophosphatase family protein [Acidimicrobiia bacterium]